MPMKSKLIIPLSDEEFNAVFPDHIKSLCFRHFTNLEVSKKVIGWLNSRGQKLRVLDLGCGVGKFCVVAASQTTHHFTGVDFREDYILIAESLKNKYDLQNLDFVSGNILDVNFGHFNAFYLFNPFLEQIDETAKLDSRYKTSPLLYSIYENHVRQQFEAMPAGTIVITYYVTPQQMPHNFKIIETGFNGFLKLWLKN